MKKWNFKTREYEHFESPAGMMSEFYMWLDWHESDDVFEVDIGCTNCAKTVKYGQCYTSRTIHNRVGLGYPVCQECYEKEWEEKRLNEETD